MTDNPQLAAWMAGRDAAADIVLDACSGQPYSTGTLLIQIRDAIRALPPPDFAAWQPPPEGERPDGFRCLGCFLGEWEIVFWHQGHWRAPYGYAEPTNFRPLPDTPEAAP